MKPKILTSLFAGASVPFSYFLLVTVSPLRVYDNGVLVQSPNNNSGIQAFIEFNGLSNSFFIYLKVAIVCFIISFIICSIHDFLNRKL